jgi:hypothetical protein
MALVTVASRVNAGRLIRDDRQLVVEAVHGVANVGSAPDWVPEDETLIGTTSTAVEISNGVPLDTGLARSEVGGSRGDKGSREGEQSGGDTGVHGVDVGGGGLGLRSNYVEYEVELERTG